MRKPRTYGDWKVTEAELKTAKNISIGNDELADANYQLVRYCHGSVCILDQAEEALRMIRGLRSGS